MQTVEILGVVEDGWPRSPKLPKNTMRELRLVRQTDMTIRVLVLRSNGTPVDLELPDTSLTLTVRERSDYKNNLIKRAATPTPLLGTGYATALILPLDTKFATPKRYVYDVSLISSGKTSVVVPLSPFVVLPSTL